MKDAGLSNSPIHARPWAVTDEQLGAELKKWSGASPALHPVGELLDRHWEAAFAYARLCTDGARAAGMLTTAAFTRLFGESLRQIGPTSAWRPHLLVTVRRIAAEWDTDSGRELLHPDLRPGGDGDRVAPRLLPHREARLLSEAFQRLPQAARCLLWHVEVEAEPPAVPAALLGLEDEDARVELRRARERLREEVLQVHRELAPEQECRHYLRLLDVTCRRGGVDIDADLCGHLGRCGHCRYTGAQLYRFDGEGLGVALAEAVLGWGAHAYREARARVNAVPEEPRARPVTAPGESAAPAPQAEPAPAAFGAFEAFAGEPFGGPEPAVPVPAAPLNEPLASVPVTEYAESTGSTGSADARPGTRRGTRGAARRSVQRAARRAARRNLAVAVLTVSGLVVLPLVLWTSLGSSDGAGDSRASRTPGADEGTATSDPSFAGAREAREGTLRGRLHNASSGLCVGIVGEKAVKGAETELAECSSAPGQRWTYETDGLMRSADAPDLCLDSSLGYSVRLAPCAAATRAGGKDVRYDFGLQGTLVSRRSQDLALTPAATDGSGALVLKTRDDSAVQRWVIDTSKTDPQMEVVNWGAETAPARTPEAGPATPRAASSPTPTPTPSATPSATPTPSSPYPAGAYCGYDPSYCEGSGGPGGGYGGGGPGGPGGGRR